ncbi:hypothetical protein CDAR_571831, partial [Caerostris darwini]
NLFARLFGTLSTAGPRLKGGKVCLDLALSFSPHSTLDSEAHIPKKMLAGGKKISLIFRIPSDILQELKMFITKEAFSVLAEYLKEFYIQEKLV